MEIKIPSEEGPEISYEQRYGVPFIDLSQFKLDPEILSGFNEQFLRNHKIFPLFRSGNALAVAMVDPHDIVTIDEIRRQTGLEIEPMVCRESDLSQAIAQHFSDVPAAQPEAEITVDETELTTIEPDAGPEGTTELDLAPRQLEEKASEAPVVRWVNHMLIRAVRDRASDVHVEPGRESVSIRFRVDGILQQIALMPRLVEYCHALFVCPPFAVPQKM